MEFSQEVREKLREQGFSILTEEERKAQLKTQIHEFMDTQKTREIESDRMTEVGTMSKVASSALKGKYQRIKMRPAPTGQKYGQVFRYNDEITNQIEEKRDRFYAVVGGEYDYRFRTDIENTDAYLIIKTMMEEKRFTLNAIIQKVKAKYDLKKRKESLYPIAVTIMSHCMLKLNKDDDVGVCIKYMPHKVTKTKGRESEVYTIEDTVYDRYIQDGIDVAKIFAAMYIISRNDYQNEYHLGKNLKEWASKFTEIYTTAKYIPSPIYLEDMIDIFGEILYYNDVLNRVHICLALALCDNVSHYEPTQEEMETFISYESNLQCMVNGKFTIDLGYLILNGDGKKPFIPENLNPLIRGAIYHFFNTEIETGIRTPIDNTIEYIAKRVYTVNEPTLTEMAISIVYQDMGGIINDSEIDINEEDVGYAVVSAIFNKLSTHGRAYLKDVKSSVPHIKQGSVQQVYHWFKSMYGDVVGFMGDVLSVERGYVDIYDHDMFKVLNNSRWLVSRTINIRDRAEKALDIIHEDRLVEPVSFDEIDTVDMRLDDEEYVKSISKKIKQQDDHMRDDLYDYLRTINPDTRKPIKQILYTGYKLCIPYDKVDFLHDSNINPDQSHTGTHEIVSGMFECILSGEPFRARDVVVNNSNTKGSIYATINKLGAMLTTEDIPPVNILRIEKDGNTNIYIPIDISRSAFLSDYKKFLTICLNKYSSVMTKLKKQKLQHEIDIVGKEKSKKSPCRFHSDMRNILNTVDVDGGNIEDVALANAAKNLTKVFGTIIDFHLKDKMGEYSDTIVYRAVDHILNELIKHGEIVSNFKLPKHTRSVSSTASKVFRLLTSSTIIQCVDAHHSVDNVVKYIVIKGKEDDVKNLLDYKVLLSKATSAIPRIQHKKMK